MISFKVTIIFLMAMLVHAIALAVQGDVFGAATNGDNLVGANTDDITTGTPFVNNAKVLNGSGQFHLTYNVLIAILCVVCAIEAAIVMTFCVIGYRDFVHEKNERKRLMQNAERRRAEGVLNGHPHGVRPLDFRFGLFTPTAPEWPLGNNLQLTVTPLDDLHTEPDSEAGISRFQAEVGHIPQETGVTTTDGTFLTATVYEADEDEIDVDPEILAAREARREKHAIQRTYEQDASFNLTFQEISAENGIIGHDWAYESADPIHCD